jgi:hypothetical protein
MRRVLNSGVLARAAAGLLLALPALAQEPGVPKAGTPAEKDSGPLFYTAFGWQNTMVADRLCPVRVEIAPMEKALSGTITLEHRQDSTQSAVITVPFSSTPEKPTRVELITAMPWDQARARVSIRDERGRLLRSQVYGDATLPLPNRVGADTGLIVSIGNTSSPESLNQWSSLMTELSGRLSLQRLPGNPARPSARDIDDTLRQGTRARALDTDLPTSWAGYDGVGILIVEGAAARTADPRALQGVRGWVARGGHLVVVAAGAGEEWRQWVPEPPPLALAEPRTLPPPPEMRAAVDAYRSRLGLLRRDLVGELEEGATPPAYEVAALAARIPGRPITLDPAAAERGWTARWGAADGALLAEGPAGLGWVAVLGVDPARAGEIASTTLSGCLWREALAASLEQVYRRSGVQSGFGFAGNYGAPPSGEAINIALEQVADVPLVGAGVFLTIVICVLGLAAMVGPGDYFGLKRLRKAQWSWLTALAWTGLASAGAYYLPRIVRTEPTSLHRLTVVDALCSPTGAAGLSKPRLTAGTGVTGLYSATSGTVRLSGVEAGSWWRGASASGVYLGDERGGGGIVPVMQAAAGGELGSERSAPLRRLPVAIWTFRTFLDLGAPALPLGASAERTAEGVRITLGNFPEGARVTRAAVQVKDGWLGLPGDTARERRLGREARRLRGSGGPEELAEPDEIGPARALGETRAGVWGGTFPASTISPEAPAAWSPGGWSQSGRLFYPSRTPTDSPGPLLDMPGPAERTGALDALAATGRYAIVHLKVESWPPDVSLSWPAKYAHTRILRLAVPLEDR